MALNFLILGSNSIDKGSMLKRAIAFLAQRVGNIIATSSVYETAAWGYASKNSYYNQALCIETLHQPLDVLKITQEIELELGRINKSNNGIYTDRPIDIDILFYDHRVINLPELTIPHPHICERRFVLAPLEELAPNFKHPIRQLTISQLNLSCTDTLSVKKLQ